VPDGVQIWHVGIAPYVLIFYIPNVQLTPLVSYSPGHPRKISLPFSEPKNILLYTVAMKATNHTLAQVLSVRNTGASVECMLKMDTYFHSSNAGYITCEGFVAICMWILERDNSKNVKMICCYHVTL
jgi:hypothetical protein